MNCRLNLPIYFVVVATIHFFVWFFLQQRAISATKFIQKKQRSGHVQKSDKGGGAYLREQGNLGLQIQYHFLKFKFHFFIFTKSAHWANLVQQSKCLYNYLLKYFNICCLERVFFSVDRVCISTWTESAFWCGSVVSSRALKTGMRGPSSHFRLARVCFFRWS